MLVCVCMDNYLNSINNNNKRQDRVGVGVGVSFGYGRWEFWTMIMAGCIVAEIK